MPIPVWGTDGARWRRPRRSSPRSRRPAGLPLAIEAVGGEGAVVARTPLADAFDEEEELVDALDAIDARALEDVVLGLVQDHDGFVEATRGFRKDRVAAIHAVVVGKKTDTRAYRRKLPKRRPVCLESKFTPSSNEARLADLPTRLDIMNHVRSYATPTLAWFRAEKIPSRPPLLLRSSRSRLLAALLARYVCCPKLMFSIPQSLTR